ncbi:MAG: SET domain-containing protein-lysine N-methyltransferase [Candidatus Paceibacterota bacterium]
MKNRMYSWMNPSLEVRDTGRYGKGIFSLKPIKKDDTLIVMGGYIFDIDDENHLNDFNCDKPIEISENFSICPINENDMDLMPQHYVNHSCEPNTGFKGSNFMVAMRDIEAGEEILYDYAMIIASNPKSTEYFTMKCLCGSKDCRGIVDEDAWKNPKLQEKYKGYFQWYLEEKIKKLNNQ